MAKQLSPSQTLKQKVEQLELLQAEQLAELKNSSTALVASLSPVQLLRNTLKEVSHSSSLKAAAIDTAMGIGAGFIGRKLYVGRSGSIISKIAGPALQFFITNFVRKKLSRRRENKEIANDEHHGEES